MFPLPGVGLRRVRPVDSVGKRIEPYSRRLAMTDKKSKEEAIKKQGEAQEKHAGEAPDKHMEAEGLAAQNNPEAGAREVED